jgi:hypothetical protein
MRAHGRKARGRRDLVRKETERSQNLFFPANGSPVTSGNPPWTTGFPAKGFRVGGRPDCHFTSDFQQTVAG